MLSASTTCGMWSLLVVGETQERLEDGGLKEESWRDASRSNMLLLDQCAVGVSRRHCGCRTKHLVQTVFILRPRQCLHARSLPVLIFPYMPGIIA